MQVRSLWIPVSEFCLKMQLTSPNDPTGSFKWCDMGSQVLSALDCEGDHPNACSSGHGMYSKDLFEAWKLVKLLK